MVKGKYRINKFNGERIFIPDSPEEAIAMRRMGIFGWSDNKYDILRTLKCAVSEER